jgi:hypothetical protein
MRESIRTGEPEAVLTAAVAAFTGKGAVVLRFRTKAI